MSTGDFTSALIPTNHSLPGAYRALRYDRGCQCFVYTGPVRRLV
jgi:hypothetical protein